MGIWSQFYCHKLTWQKPIRTASWKRNEKIAHVAAQKLCSEEEHKERKQSMQKKE